MKKIDLYHVTFVVTDRCNSSCSYCYNHFDEKIKYREMNDDQIDNIILFLKNNIITDHKVKFSLIGGETLLKIDFIKKLIKKIDTLKLQDYFYGLNTNLIEISNETMDFLVNNNIKTMISLDGIKECHNKNRKSWEKIIKNTIKLYFKYKSANRLEKLSVVSTLTNNNFDYLLKNYYFFKELGIRCFFNLNGDCFWEDYDMKIITQQIKNLSKQDEIFKNIHMAHYSPNRRACEQIYNNVVIGPDYKLYYCHRMTFGESYGDIWNGYYNQNYFNKMLDVTTNLPEKCKNCSIVDYCHNFCIARTNRDSVCKYTKGLLIDE